MRKKALLLHGWGGSNFPRLTCDIKELASFYPCELPTNLYADNSILICSDNDPYVNISEIQSIQKSLNIELKIIKNAGHINADSGFGEWQWILQEIQNDYKN
ncbi:MAG: hypothetical protein COB17_01790 [Sulfurimonas sp.]|nr:MAG: hypothetical protein COB17_01790 [Sulfurimonas sp.]